MNPAPPRQHHRQGGRTDRRRRDRIHRLGRRQRRLPAGFAVSKGELTLFGIVAAGVLLKWADNWFDRYGSWTVFRTFISLPAGVAKMPFWRFSAFTLLGSIPWVLALAIVGEKVGDNWEDWRHKLGYLDYAVAVAIVVGVVYWIVKRRRNRGDDDGAVIAGPEFDRT